jgi:hypothetical protein
MGNTYHNESFPRTGEFTLRNVAPVAYQLPQVPRIQQAILVGAHDTTCMCTELAQKKMLLALEID